MRPATLTKLANADGQQHRYVPVADAHVDHNRRPMQNQRQEHLRNLTAVNLEMKANGQRPNRHLHRPLHRVAVQDRRRQHHLAACVDQTNNRAYDEYSTTQGTIRNNLTIGQISTLDAVYVCSGQTEKLPYAYLFENYTFDGGMPQSTP